MDRIVNPNGLTNVLEEDIKKTREMTVKGRVLLGEDEEIIQRKYDLFGK